MDSAQAAEGVLGGRQVRVLTEPLLRKRADGSCAQSLRVVVEGLGDDLQLRSSDVVVRTSAGETQRPDLAGGPAGSIRVLIPEVTEPRVVEISLPSVEPDRTLQGGGDTTSFRVQLPLDVAHEWRFAAADGQMGCLVRLYREWRLSGDDAFLRDLWPSARKALEFAWVPGGWDADRDGVMEGCQHNTMDVEYFGPNPEIGVWYLAALRACEEMARYVGEDDFAEICADMFQRGSEWIDEHLFNGDYYVHEIRPPGDEKAIAPGLRLLTGARDLSDPELQIGDGCLADQLVGQVLAHAAGLGYLLDRQHIQTTLQSILRYNRRDGINDSFNPMRSFALGDEPGLTVASYPKGNRPTRPFPYFAEVWTGLEYTAASGMFYENMHEQGLGMVEDTRSRFDGRRRNPFNEAECGHHYVRAMASWGSFVALTGFGYDAATGTIRFASAGDPVTWFWSNGQAWGTMSQHPAPDATVVGLDVHGGSLRLCRLVLTGAGSADLDDQTLTSGQRVEIQVPSRGPRQ